MFVKRFLTSVITVAALTSLCACNVDEQINSSTTVTVGNILESSVTTGAVVTTIEEPTTSVVAEITVVAENEVLETTKSGVIGVDITVPDAEFLLELCNKWLSEEVLENGKFFALLGSPTGTVTALYTDIDGDLTAEFCFIVDAYGSSALYVCDYINEAWKVTDILTIAKQYTYLQKTDNGATSLFAVVGSRAAEGLTSYVYNNGVEEAFEMFDYTAFYDNELAAAENADDVYYKAIENAISKYDNLTYLYDLPCVTADLVNDVRFLGSDFAPDGFDSDAVQTKFDAFTAEVATLFQ